jgi:hypothetical protein
MVSARQVVGILLSWALLVAPLAAAVDVNIDRNPVQVNESFQLVFTTDHSPAREPDFSVLQQDFLVVRNNRSNNISIINGEYQRSVKWTLQLMAKQIGEYTIPAIRFGDESSEPFQVTVEPASLASVPHDQQVLEVTLDRSEVYVQGQVILTIRLLSATDISAYEFGEIPAQDLDLVVEPLGGLRQYQTRIADRSYLVLEQQFALFPQRSGQLDIPPLQGEVRLPSRSSFDPFNTGGDIRRFNSQPLTLDVKPIPARMAGEYWLPADHVELREQWPEDLDGLVAGEPITRSIQLIADGVTAAQLPEIELQAIDGIKQYPDQPVLRDERGGQGIRALRAQKVALIPGSPGVYRVPSLAVKWWNRATETIETATLPARELVVADSTGNAAVEPPPVSPAPASAQPAGEVGADRASRFWVWLSLLLAGGWGASAVYWWYTSRRARTTEPPRIEAASLRSATRALREACERNDAATVRAALLPWGQALLAPQQVANLHALAPCLGVEFRQEIEALNQSLYAVDGESWQGQALWTLCQRLQQQGSSRKSTVNEGLTPLTPE